MNGRTSDGDGGFKDLVQASGEATGFSRREGAGGTKGGEPRIKENLGHINIADPGEEEGVGQRLPERSRQGIKNLLDCWAIESEGIGSGAGEKM
jgi:hypothetical protein